MGLGTARTSKPEMDGDERRGKQANMLRSWLASAMRVEKYGNGGGDSSQVPDKKATRLLVVIGTYSIGKEKIVKGMFGRSIPTSPLLFLSMKLGVAKAIGSKIYCSESKRKIIDCLDDPELHSLLTHDPLEASVHVTSLFAIKQDSLSDYLDQFSSHFDKILGLRPTGWTFRQGQSGDDSTSPSVSKTIADLSHSSMPTALYPQRDSTERCQAFSVCYSEHSSFSELVSKTMTLAELV
jgi:DNA cross-link repair 1A protein